MTDFNSKESQQMVGAASKESHRLSYREVETSLSAADEAPS